MMEHKRSRSFASRSLLKTNLTTTPTTLAPSGSTIASDRVVPSQVRTTDHVSSSAMYTSTGHRTTVSAHARNYSMEGTQASMMPEVTTSGFGIVCDEPGINTALRIRHNHQVIGTPGTNTRPQPSVERHSPVSIPSWGVDDPQKASALDSLHHANIELIQTIDVLRAKVSECQDETDRYAHEIENRRTQHEAEKTRLKRQIAACNFNLAREGDINMLSNEIDGELARFHYLKQINESSTSEDLVRFLRESENVISALESRLDIVKQNYAQQNQRYQRIITENQERLMALESTLIKYSSKK